MTDAFKIVPTADYVATGVRDTETLANALADIVADTYRLVFKTHACHWNVEGPLFYSVHTMTEAQYEDMFAATDVLAERIRALGELAPMQLEAVVAQSRVRDGSDKMTAQDMISDLASDHEQLAHRLHALIELAGVRKDPVTEDLATARSAFHEKAAWMLRALAKS